MFENSKVFKVSLIVAAACFGATAGTVTLAWASGETCSVSYPSGITCSVINTSVSGGVTSFTALASDFAQEDTTHNFIFVDGSSNRWGVTVSSGGPLEDCSATPTNPRACSASCSCIGSCSCSGGEDFVFCEGWVQAPDGSWEVEGYGEIC
jgi:hypothetical protein